VEPWEAAQASGLLSQVIEGVLREIGHGNQKLPLRLRERAENGGYLLEAHTRNQPRDLLGVDDIEQRLGDDQRNPVTRLRGIKLIKERKLVAADRELIREKLGACLGHFALHEIRA